MNKRIKEIAELAGFENGHQDRNGNSLSYELEKFAELIVQECVNAMLNTDEQKFVVETEGWELGGANHGAWDRGILDAVATLKEHFNEKAESTDYAGNGTAGREADVKPTGFFFRMSNRDEMDLITDAIAAVKYAAEEDQKISHSKHIDKHYRDALACLNVKLTGARVSRVRAQTIGK